MKKQLNEGIGLEQYYSGDDNWCSFVEIAKQDFKERISDEKYLDFLTAKLENKQDLAYVIFYFFNESSLKWVEKKIPALNDITPLDCLESESLIRRLREALLRTPL